MTGRIDAVDEAAQARDAAAYRAQLEAVAERRSAARAELDAANAELARWCGAADQDRPGVHDPRPRGRGRRASTGCQRSGRCRGAQARAARVGHGDRLEHQGVSPRRGSAAGRRGRICWAFRTGVEAKFVADVNLNADRARRGAWRPRRPTIGAGSSTRQSNPGARRGMSPGASATAGGSAAGCPRRPAPRWRAWITASQRGGPGEHHHGLGVAGATRGSPRRAACEGRRPAGPGRGSSSRCPDGSVCQL